MGMISEAIQSMHDRHMISVLEGLVNEVAPLLCPRCEKGEDIFEEDEDWWHGNSIDFMCAATDLRRSAQKRIEKLKEELPEPYVHFLLGAYVNIQKEVVVDSDGLATITLVDVAKGLTGRIMQRKPDRWGVKVKGIPDLLWIKGSDLRAATADEVRRAREGECQS